MIVLSIPFHSNNQVEKLFGRVTYPRDLTELRLDCSSDPFTVKDELVSDSTILTIRSGNEGGYYKGSLKNKLEYCRKMISRRNCLIDLELAEYKAETIPPDKLILSYHEQGKELDPIRIGRVIERSNRIPSRYLKIVLPVNRYLDLLEIPAMISKSLKPVLFAGSSDLGKLSRILFSHLGGCGTYLGLPGHETARDQLNPEEAGIFNLNSVNADYFLGGIIGGDQVKYSLGLRHYNKLFRDKNLPAVYLPFEVKDPEDFLAWAYNCEFKDQFYGFSITMPLKGYFAARFGSAEAAVNYCDPRSRQTVNTDTEALKKSLDELNIKPGDPLLIIGSGAMAEIALIMLHESHEIWVRARNGNRLKELSRNYRFAVFKQTATNRSKFKLIINCTPLGLNGENAAEGFELDPEVKIIDLPYGSGKTPLIDHCLNRGIRHIDGRRFWKWQAAEQEKLFLTNIRKRL